MPRHNAYRVPSWSPFPSGCITSTHIQTQGLGFLVRSHWSQYVYYFASPLHGSYQAHTQFFVLLVKCRLLIKNWSGSCCVLFLCSGIHYLFCHAPLCLTCTHTRTHTQFMHTACPRAIPTCRIKQHPFVFGIFEMQTNKCSGGREGKTGRKQKTARWKQKQFEEMQKQTDIKIVWWWWWRW